MITFPSFSNLEPEIIADFNTCLFENIEQIEVYIYKLDSNEDPDLINELYRAMHSLKENCRMVLLTPFADIVQHMESLLTEMREGTRFYHQLYGSVFISIVSVIEIMITQITEQGKCRQDILDLLAGLVKQIFDCKPSIDNDDLNIAEKVLSQLFNLQEVSIVADDSIQTSQSTKGKVEANETENNSNSAKLKTNLNFFKDLAFQMDNLSIYRQGRTKDVLKLCMAVNKELANPVDQQQLAAAVYIHDLGMAFVHPSILNKQETLSKEEVNLIRQHVITGAEMLKNIDNWQEATVIVEQHHERYDGSGYPKGLKQDEIHPGAMLLSLADTYCAITNERRDRSFKRNLFSAVTLINGEKDRQFAPDFVEIFNETIRKLYIKPAQSE